MPMTSYLMKKLGDHSIGKAAFTMPTTVYLALFTASPGIAGSVAAEASGGSYARVEITSKMGSFDSVTGISLSTSEIVFPLATGTWGDLTHVGILDHISASTNMLYYQALTVPRTIVSGSRALKFAIGQLRLELF